MSIFDLIKLEDRFSPRWGDGPDSGSGMDSGDSYGVSDYGGFGPTSPGSSTGLGSLGGWGTGPSDEYGPSNNEGPTSPGSSYGFGSRGPSDFQAPGYGPDSYKGWADRSEDPTDQPGMDAGMQEVTDFFGRPTGDWEYSHAGQGMMSNFGHFISSGGLFDATLSVGLSAVSPALGAAYNAYKSYKAGGPAAAGTSLVGSAITGAGLFGRIGSKIAGPVGSAVSSIAGASLIDRATKSTPSPGFSNKMASFDKDKETPDLKSKTPMGAASIALSNYGGYS